MARRAQVETNEGRIRGAPREGAGPLPDAEPGAGPLAAASTIVRVSESSFPSSCADGRPRIRKPRPGDGTAVAATVETGSRQKGVASDRRGPRRPADGPGRSGVRAGLATRRPSERTYGVATGALASRPARAARSGTPRAEGIDAHHPAARGDGGAAQGGGAGPAAVEEDAGAEIG